MEENKTGAEAVEPRDFTRLLVGIAVLVGGLALAALLYYGIVVQGGGGTAEGMPLPERHSWTFWEGYYG